MAFILCNRNRIEHKAPSRSVINLATPRPQLTRGTKSCYNSRGVKPKIANLKGI
jgi:hypothetical protein